VALSVVSPDALPPETAPLSLHDALPIFLTAQRGKPYIWGGVGPGGYDCSGLTSAVENVFRGLYPYRRRHTTHSFLGAPPPGNERSEEHTSELSHVKISYAVFCLKKQRPV